MPNDAMRDVWSESGVGWVEHEQMFDAVLAPFAEAIARAADISAGDRVLDVGCGSGTLLEHAVAAGARPVGVDISEPMVQAARRRVPNADVVLADAQIADLRAHGPFDRIVSRFGVMFFDDPVSAFANIHRSAAPGATLTFVCWRDHEDLMFSLGTSILTARLEAPAAAEDPLAPGPLALADRDRTTAVLSDAGWADITIEPFEGLCDYGVDGSDGVEERLAMIMSTTTGRRARAELEPRLGADGWAQLVDDVREELRRHRVDGVVKFVGHTWLVTAKST